MVDDNDLISSEDIARCDRNVKRFLLFIIIGYIVFYGLVVGITYLVAS
jgi:hypothetical protein